MPAKKSAQKSPKKTPAKRERALTLKQNAFFAAYLETGNASEAYRLSYNVTGMAPSTIAKEARRLLKHPLIAPRLKQESETVVKIARERGAVTIESITSMLQDAFEKAEENSQTGAMVAAAMGMGKLNGLIVDKKADVTPEHDITAINARINSLMAGGEEAGASGAVGGEGALVPAEQVEPTVPGHGTA